MTILSEPPVASSEQDPGDRKAARKRSFGSAAVSWVTSTDHKVIGYMYLVTATFWFFAADHQRAALEFDIDHMQSHSLRAAFLSTVATL